jgi:hypothetical protein
VGWSCQHSLIYNYYGLATLIKFYLFEIVMVGPHFNFTFFLIFVCVSWNLFFIIKKFMGSCQTLGMIISQMKMMIFKLLKLVAVESTSLNISPIFHQSFISGLKFRFVIIWLQACPSKGIFNLIILFCRLFRNIILVIYGVVGCWGGPKRKVTCSLVHLWRK